MSGTTASLIATIISSVLTLVGVLLTNKSNANKIQSELKTELKIAQAVTDTKIEELTREVREHNNFARRVPVLEEQMKVANHRIEDLERKCDK